MKSKKEQLKNLLKIDNWFCWIAFFVGIYLIQWMIIFIVFGLISILVISQIIKNVKNDVIKRNNDYSFGKEEDGTVYWKINDNKINLGKINIYSINKLKRKIKLLSIKRKSKNKYYEYINNMIFWNKKEIKIEV